VLDGITGKKRPGGDFHGILPAEALDQRMRITPRPFAGDVVA
jgi:hypothetical protein